jgi:hypothetical protein
MYDLSVATIDGTSFKLSEVLREKKGVVINFFHTDSSISVEEFGYLQAASKLFGEDVAVIAMNGHKDTEEEVKSFQQSTGVTFGVAWGGSALPVAFGLTAYPTTVIVDREGYICLSHTGMFTDSQPLMNAVKYFTQEDYRQSFFETIEGIPTVE